MPKPKHPLQIYMCLCPVHDRWIEQVKRPDTANVKEKEGNHAIIYSVLIQSEQKQRDKDGWR